MTWYLLSMKIARDDVVPLIGVMRVSQTSLFFPHENSEKQRQNSERFCCSFARRRERDRGRRRKTRSRSLIIFGKNSEKQRERRETEDSCHRGSVEIASSLRSQKPGSARHSEARSAEAISVELSETGTRLLRYARNDLILCRYLLSARGCVWS